MLHYVTNYHPDVEGSKNPIVPHCATVPQEEDTEEMRETNSQLRSWHLNLTTVQLTAAFRRGVETDVTAHISDVTAAERADDQTDRMLRTAHVALFA